MAKKSRLTAILLCTSHDQTQQGQPCPHRRAPSPCPSSVDWPGGHTVESHHRCNPLLLVAYVATGARCIAGFEHRPPGHQWASNVRQALPTRAQQRSLAFVAPVASTAMSTQGISPKPPYQTAWSRGPTGSRRVGHVHHARWRSDLRERSRIPAGAIDYMRHAPCACRHTVSVRSRAGWGGWQGWPRPKTRAEGGRTMRSVAPLARIQSTTC
jgi:hypothetical protein